ncbi:hypothetical protein PVAP13_8KG268600 [Panicum virgatum]|uniref:Uncharacterized protein n=1 Tax=Panicum virgatum TaxID=38727 RepID=A0A8T0PW50_PANVG|nr:hypothetical protein PVAP13_8KG268600 [Panicum virgatum]
MEEVSSKMIFGNIRFVGMQRIPFLFVRRPLFAEVLARALDQIHCNSNEGELKVEGVLHYVKSDLTYHSRLLTIACQDDWENYINGVMNNEIPVMDLLVRKLSSDSSPRMHSPPRNIAIHAPLHARGLSREQEFAGPPDPPIQNRPRNVQDTVLVSNAESGPNLDGNFPDPAAHCRNHDVVTTAHEIPLSQNHPNIPNNAAVPPVPPATSTGVPHGVDFLQAFIHLLYLLVKVGVHWLLIIT